MLSGPAAIPATMLATLASAAAVKGVKGGKLRHRPGPHPRGVRPGGVYAPLPAPDV